MMTDEAWEAFVQKELAGYAGRISSGSSIDFPEAKVWCRKGENGEEFTDEKAAIVVLAMPDADDRDAIRAIREQAARRDGFLVSVKLELWAVELPKDADEALVARLEEAKAAHALDKFDKRYRKEKLQVFLEAEDHQIRVFYAEILRHADGTSSVGPWEEAQVTLPRPGFRRYLPVEIRDGVKTLVMRF